MSGVGDFFSNLGDTLGITRHVRAPQVNRQTGRVVDPGSDTGPGLLGNLANAAGGIGSLIGGPVGGMIGNAVGGLVGGGSGGAQPMGGGAPGGAQNPLSAVSGALGQLAGVDPSVLLTSLGGQALGGAARAAGLAPEHIAALTNLAQQQNLQAQNQQLEQNQAAVGRAVNTRVTEAINPQLAQITQALQEQRNQVQATAEHRAITAQENFQRDLMERLDRMDSRLTAATSSLPAPRRY